MSCVLLGYTLYNTCLIILCVIFICVILSIHYTHVLFSYVLYCLRTIHMFLIICVKLATLYMSNKPMCYIGYILYMCYNHMCYIVYTLYMSYNPMCYIGYTLYMCFNHMFYIVCTLCMYLNDMCYIFYTHVILGYKFSMLGFSFGISHVLYRPTGPKHHGYFPNCSKVSIINNQHLSCEDSATQFTSS